MSFENKTGIITGAARGIGKAIAAQFVNMGGRAVIVDVNEEQAKETAQELGNAVAYAVDLGDTDAVKTVFNQIIADMGKVDVLINNAGIVNTTEFGELTLEEWDKVLAVDLTAPFLTCQILFNHMKDNGGGRIVNIASVAGKVGGGFLGTAAYGAAKAGLISLTKSLAKAGSAYNVYCNSLCPSYTKTPMVTILQGEREAKVLDQINLHRPASPDEMANSILFLASDAASFVQGENLNCDGGLLMNG
ncbi:MAG: SDR family oxidoreductase [Firmicutes bacterium]|nr:SDR family oxidoreductase [Bacillota bacterium]